MFRCAKRVSKYVIVDIHFLGNDIATSSNSFKYSDTPGGPDARSAAPTATGADQSTAAGLVQNLATICQILMEAWRTNGYPDSELLILFTGAHAQPQEPALTGYPLMFQGVCDWTDNSATYATQGFSYNSRVAVMRTDRIIDHESIRDLLGYNQAAVYTIDQITNTNPTVIRTTTAHGLSQGDRIGIMYTNETVNTGKKLSPSSAGTGDPSPTWWTCATSGSHDTTHIVIPANVAVAGTSGKVVVQKDYSHLRVRGHITLGRLIVDAMLGEAFGVVEGQASSQTILIPIPMP